MKIPPYETFPQMFTDQIVLREVQSSDIKDIVEISFYDSRSALTVEDATEMQGRINLDYQNGSSIHWGIADRRTNVIMGTLGFYRGFDRGIGELGCVLKPEFHGKGFMTTAIKLVIEFGFYEMGLMKIIAITTKQNSNAVKLLRRLDFIEVSNLQEDKIEYQFVNKILANQ